MIMFLIFFYVEIVVAESINRRPPLSDYMMLTTDYVPAELGK